MAERGCTFAVRFYESVGSTNTVLAELARSGAPEFTAVIAGTQTAGRGRGEHRFFSPAGCGIYFSLLLRPKFPAATAGKADYTRRGCGCGAGDRVRLGRDCGYKVG